MHMDSQKARSILFSFENQSEFTEMKENSAHFESPFAALFEKQSKVQNEMVGNRKMETGFVTPSCKDSIKQQTQVLASDDLFDEDMTPNEQMMTTATNMNFVQPSQNQLNPSQVLSQRFTDNANPTNFQMKSQLFGLSQLSQCQQSQTILKSQILGQTNKQMTSADIPEEDSCHILM